MARAKKAKKRVSKTACAKRGGRFSKRKGHAATCTIGKKRKSAKKGKKRGAKKGKKGGVSKATRKARMAKACRAMSAVKKVKMAGLCGWATS